MFYPKFNNPYQMNMPESAENSTVVDNIFYDDREPGTYGFDYDVEQVPLTQVEMSNSPYFPTYAKGGAVKKGKAQEDTEEPKYEMIEVYEEDPYEEFTQGLNPYPSLAEMIRQQGEGEDTVLAHINSREAQALSLLSGGSVNPVTGLPQFGLFSNPKKWLKGSLGGAAGAVIGNMIMPGIGGIIGGALGGAAGSAIRGRKDFASAALRGAGMGAALPTVSGLLASGANAIGQTSAAKGLSDYATKNAILPSIGNLIGSDNPIFSSSGVAAGDSSDAAGITRALGVKNAPVSSATQAEPVSVSWMSKFMEPKNLLTAASVAGNILGREKPPKPKSPEEEADEKKRYERALRLNSNEMAEKEAYETALAQAERRTARNKFLPEERINIEPLHIKTHTPEEYKKYGRWLAYYDNPQFEGQPVYGFSEGGVVSLSDIIAGNMHNPVGFGYYVEGSTGGQDDKVPALLSDGEYVIDSATVSDLGDGNNKAGAKKLDQMRENIRKHKRGGNVKLPPKSLSLTSYLRG